MTESPQLANTTVIKLSLGPMMTPECSIRPNPLCVSPCEQVRSVKGSKNNFYVRENRLKILELFTVHIHGQLSQEQQSSFCAYDMILPRAGCCQYFSRVIRETHLGAVFLVTPAWGRAHCLPHNHQQEATTSMVA